MTHDELKSILKGIFVVMETGTHPIKTRLRLFLDRGVWLFVTVATVTLLAV